MRSTKSVGFVFIPVLAIAIGAMVAHQNGTSYLSFLPNFVGVILGIPLLLGSNAVASFVRRNVLLVPMAAIILIALTLSAPGQASVHRWLPLGPLSLNASMVLTPVVLFGIAYGRELESLLLTAILSVILVLQPDAGQATAFASAATVLFLSEGRMRPVTRWSGFLLVAISWAIAWSIHDPLPPVEHVERILHLGFSQGLVSSLACTLAIVLLFIPIAQRCYQGREPKLQALSLSYLVYLLVSFAVTEIGNFPVPVIGAGAAPVIGWFLMMSLARVP